jgi:hypothetical protein
MKYILRNMPHVGKIEVKIVTANRTGAGTNGEAYLGIGGREFLLDIPGRDDFEKGHTDNFVIGVGSNIKNQNSESSGINGLPTVDPPTTGENSPGIEFEWLQNNLFPAYIRFKPDDAGDNWNIESVDVTATRFPDQSATIKYNAFANPDPDNIWLGDSSGLVLGLLRVP